MNAMMNADGARQMGEQASKNSRTQASATDLWTRARDLFAFALVGTVLCSCGTTRIKSTWRSPDFHGGPPQKVAIIAITDQPLVRTALENRFANQLEKQGQPAIPTAKLMSLPEIKENKEIAGARLRQAGADSVVIMKLASRSTYENKSGRTPNEFYSVTTGSPSEGWYTYYVSAYSGTDPAPIGLRDRYLLDTSLFDLSTGKRIWSCLTETELKENSDRLEIADSLVAKVVGLMVEEGVVR